VLIETAVWNLAGVQAPKPALWQVSQFVIDTPASVWYGM
jgi:hypothetical protein